MKSVMNGINKKEATLLLRALKNHSYCYEYYKNGDEWDGGYVDLKPEELDDLFDLTELLAEKIGVDTSQM